MWEMSRTTVPGGVKNLTGSGLRNFFEPYQQPYREAYRPPGIVKRGAWSVGWSVPGYGARRTEEKPIGVARLVAMFGLKR